MPVPHSLAATIDLSGAVSSESIRNKCSQFPEVFAVASAVYSAPIRRLPPPYAYRSMHPRGSCYWGLSDDHVPRMISKVSFNGADVGGWPKSHYVAFCLAPDKSSPSPHARIQGQSRSWTIASAFMINGTLVHVTCRSVNGNV